MRPGQNGNGKRYPRLKINKQVGTMPPKKDEAKDKTGRSSKQMTFVYDIANAQSVSGPDDFSEWQPDAIP